MSESQTKAGNQKKNLKGPVTSPARPTHRGRVPHVTFANGPC